MLRKMIICLLLLGLCAGCAWDADMANALEGTLLFQGVRFESVEPLPDGDYLVVGCILKNPGDDASDSENYWAWAARVDVQGEVLWENTYQVGGGFTEAACLADGSLLLGMEYVHQDFYKLAVVQIDGQGQLLSDPIPLRAAGFFYKGVACLILQESPEEFSPGDAPVLHAVGAKGETLWRQEYPSLTGSGHFVKPTEDGYLLAGTIQDYPYDQSIEGTYAFAAKLDKKGDLLWQGQASEAPGSGIQAYVEMPDGGMVGVGDHTGFRFNSSGVLEWIRDYRQEPMFVQFSDLWLQPGGNLLVLGDTAARDGGGPYFLQLDDTGEVLKQWRQPIANNGYQIKSDLFIARDALYHICTYRTVDDDYTSPYITAVTTLKLPE